ncbi:MAG TPA: Holliday junction branch migration protein RuvA [Solirubrobacteraceae bacterium]|nr:Holliday junction branch migration protein RuvA [Solirubrobacteraceae bacterium]
MRGELAVRGEDHVVIMCAGVGYRLAVSRETLARLPAVGQQATLNTHLIVRDDSLLLYGFHSEIERELFLMLLSVQSVGPKVALATLSGGPPSELLGALAAGDASRFQAVPGVGKRTAERIIVELRERALGSSESADPIVVTRGDDPRRIAREGLVELGFVPAEVDQLLAGAEGDTAQELISAALRLSHGRAARS